MEELVRICKITNTHALKGEVRMMSFTDFPDERFKVGAHMFIRTREGDKEVEVATHRVHKGIDLVSFKGMQDINLIEGYKGCECYAYKDDSLLEEGEYYVDDLANCQVYQADIYIGDVIDVYDNTYQDILVIKHEGKKVLVPYVDAFVKNVDIDAKRIDVELIEGFLDEN